MARAVKSFLFARCVNKSARQQRKLLTPDLGRESVLSLDGETTPPTEAYLTTKNPEGLAEAIKILEMDAEIKRLQSERDELVKAFERATTAHAPSQPSAPSENESDDDFNLRLLRKAIADRPGWSTISTSRAGMILDAVGARGWEPRPSGRHKHRRADDIGRIRYYFAQMGLQEIVDNRIDRKGQRTSQFLIPGR